MCRYYLVPLFRAEEERLEDLERRDALAERLKHKHKEDHGEAQEGMTTHKKNPGTITKMCLEIVFSYICRPMRNWQWTSRTRIKLYVAQHYSTKALE